MIDDDDLAFFEARGAFTGVKNISDDACLKVSPPPWHVPSICRPTIKHRERCQGFWNDIPLAACFRFPRKGEMYCFEHRPYVPVVVRGNMDPDELERQWRRLAPEIYL